MIKLLFVSVLLAFFGKKKKNRKVKNKFNGIFKWVVLYNETKNYSRLKIHLIFHREIEIKSLFFPSPG
jgi:hypothetical protein